MLRQKIQLKILNFNFFLFRAISIVKQSDKEKKRYSGYGITFDS